MKIKTVFALLASIASLVLGSFSVQAQNALPAHKDLVADNPNADADISLYTTYMDTWFKGDLVKLRQLVAPNFTGTVPPCLILVR